MKGSLVSGCGAYAAVVRTRKTFGRAPTCRAQGYEMLPVRRHGGVFFFVFAFCFCAVAHDVVIGVRPRSARGLSCAGVARWQGVYRSGARTGWFLATFKRYGVKVVIMHSSSSSSPGGGLQDRHECARMEMGNTRSPRSAPAPSSERQSTGPWRWTETWIRTCSVKRRRRR